MYQMCWTLHNFCSTRHLEVTGYTWSIFHLLGPLCFLTPAFVLGHLSSLLCCRVVNISACLTDSNLDSDPPDPGMMNSVQQLLVFLSLREASGVIHTSDSHRWDTLCHFLWRSFKGVFTLIMFRAVGLKLKSGAFGSLFQVITGFQVRWQIMTLVHETVWYWGWVLTQIYVLFNTWLLFF